MMRKTFSFGKIKYANPTRRLNEVTLDVELRDRGGDEVFVIDQKTGSKTITGYAPKYKELSICGNIWNAHKTDIFCGGQCLDTINEYRTQLKDRKLFDELYSMWKQYHLNGMHAGTPEQEEAINEWKQSGHRYEYKEVCDMLKAIDLYEVNYTGPSVGRMYNNEPYRYGSAWLIRELPEDVIQRVEELLTA